MNTYITEANIKKLFSSNGIMCLIDEYSASLTFEIGKALGTLFQKKKSKIVLGHDGDNISKMIALAVASGALFAGADVLFIDTCVVGELVFAIKELSCDLGVIVTQNDELKSICNIKIYNGIGFYLSREQENYIEYFINNNDNYIFSNRIGKFINKSNIKNKYINYLKLKSNPIIPDCYKVYISSNNKIVKKIFKKLFINQKNNKKNKIIELKFNNDASKVEILINNDAINIENIIFHLIENKNQSILAFNQSVNKKFCEELDKREIKYFDNCNNGERALIETMLKNKINLGFNSFLQIICLDESSTSDGILAALKIIALNFENIIDLYPQKVIKTNFTVEQIMLDKNLSMKFELCDSLLINDGRILIENDIVRDKANIVIESENRETLNLIVDYIKCEI